MSCSGCPSTNDCHVTRGPSGQRVAVVLESPTEQEVAKDEFLYGKPGGATSLLKQILEHYVDDLDDIYFTSAVNCRPNPKKKAMQKNAMLACSDRLVDELLDAGVEKVLCTGPMGWGALTGERKLPAITGVRGRWREAHGMMVMATLPPGFAIGAYEYFRDIIFDVDKFFTTEGPQPQPEVTMWTPESLAEIDEAFTFLESFDYMSADLETTGFSPISCYPIAAGFGVITDVDTKAGTVVVITDKFLDSKRVWRRIGRLLSSPKEIVLHNAKFDIKHLKHQLETRGLEYRPVNLQDTMMLHYALDERPMGKFKAHGLEKMAALRCDAPEYGINMEEFLTRWREAAIAEVTGDDDNELAYLRDLMNKYMALDVYYTARLYPELYNECLDEDERLLDFYDKILMPGTVALAEVEYRGILLDRGMYERSLADLNLRIEPILERIREYTGDSQFNPGSPKQVKEFVYGTCGMKVETAMSAAAAEVTQDNISSNDSGMRSRGTYTDPSRLLSSPTAAPVLRMLARGYPEHSQFLIDVCDWRNLAKNAGTYLEGLLRRCDTDGRIRGTLNLHGTASGRLSSTNPNLQNMPPASHTGIAIRSGFRAPPGWSLIDADYKQLEVRVAAELSHDEAMHEMFASGGDPHSQTSEIIYGKADVSHYERMLGKIITFGLLYGRSPDSIATGPEAEDIVARGGKRWAPEDVRAFFSNLMGTWAQYAAWRDDCKKAPYKLGEITFSVGRKRRFDFIPKHDGGHAGRQGINTPCQGTASDFCLYAVIRLTEVLKPHGAYVISTVHDSILVECPDDKLDVVVPLVKHTMEKDTLWETYIPLAADIKVSKRWGEDDDLEYGGLVLDSDEAAAQAELV